MDKPRVLFLCTGNSARSQMAEAFLRAYGGDHFDVYSAGLEPKGRILPDVLLVMQEIGLDMAGQTSKGVEEYLGKMVFAHTVTVCGDAEENCPAVFLNMGKHEHWPFDDPERLEAVRAVRDGISARVLQWLEEQDIQPKLS